MTAASPVTGSVLAKDLAERAGSAFVQAAVPSLILTLQAPSWGDAKAFGYAALVAGGTAVLSLAKGLAAQRLTGTASLSRAVGRASTDVAPTQPEPDPAPAGRHAYVEPSPVPRPRPRQEGA